MSVLAVPFYVFGKALSALLGIKESMTTQFTVSMINAILTAFSCVIVYRFALDRLNFRSSTGLFLATGFGLSTIAWCYSEGFMSEPATTLFSLYAVYFATNPDKKRKKHSLLFAGAFLACAVSCRLATLLAVPGFVFYHWMMWKNEQKAAELWADISRAAIPVVSS
jgi:4-amino-4-deoxy-L-arabinose transferase-like glycosyltransferase